MTIASNLIRFKDRPGVQRVLRNSGWMMGEQVFRLLVALFVGVWLARHLGPENFGRLSFALSFASLFGICATLGLNRILVRELVKCEQDEAQVIGLMSTTLAMRLVAAGLMYGLCSACAWFWGDGNFFLIAIIAGGFIFSAFDCIELYYQARVQSRRAATARLISFTCVTAVRIGLLVSGAALTAFAVLAVVELAAAAFALLLVYRGKGPGFSSHSVNWGLGKALLMESWPEIIAGLGCLLFMRMDQIMLQSLAGSVAVGKFAVAARLSEIWYFVPGAIVASTFPGIVAQREISYAVYIQRLQMLLGALVGLAYVAALCATVFSYPVIHLLYGDAYVESASILIVHIWCGVFMVLGIASGSWIMAEKKVKLNLFRNLLGAAVNVALNIILIPVYGGIGAAYATLIAFAVAFFAVDFFVPSMKEMSRMKLKALLVYPALTAKPR